MSVLRALGDRGPVVVQQLDDRSAVVGPPLGDGREGVQEGFQGVVLEHVTGDARPEEREDGLRTRVHAVHQHTGPGGHLTDLQDRFDPADAGHGDVEEQDVRLEGPGLLNGHGPIRCFPDHLELIASSEDGSNPVQHEPVVVRDEDGGPVRAGHGLFPFRRLARGGVSAIQPSRYLVGRRGCMGCTGYFEVPEA